MRVLKALPAGIYLTIMPQQSTQEAILESVSLQKCTPHITVIDLPRFVFSSSFTSFHFFFSFCSSTLVWPGALPDVSRGRVRDTDTQAQRVDADALGFSLAFHANNLFLKGTRRYAL